MGKTSIQWATHTENWLSGCTKISPACTNCYAETMTARLARMPKSPPQYRDGVAADQRWTGRIAYNPEALRAAFNGLREARHPRRVFINSMSDTFHADAPPESLRDLATYIHQHEVIRAAKARMAARDFMLDTPEERVDEVNAGLMRRADHVIMLLTKRPDRLLAWQREYFPAGLPSWVWVGCTVEDQRRADERIPMLLQVQAMVRFLSMEPLLELVDLAYAAFNGADSFGSLEGIHWVIAGGESGPRARPSHPQWFRALRDQCESAGVPYHFKQWGEWIPQGQRPRDESAPITDQRGIDFTRDLYADRIGKKAAGRLLDGRTHDGLPGAP